MKRVDQSVATPRSVGFSWIVFAGFGALMVVYGVNAMLLPHTDPTHWDWLMKEEHFAYFSGHWHRIGMIALGAGIFSLASAVTGYRRGERWAWFAAWYWPALFLLLAVDSWSGVVFVPFVALSLVTLVVPYRRFFPRT